MGESEIRDFVSEYPDWRFFDGELKALFKLKDFAEAMKVINSVAEQAERLNHHPTWTNSYNKLSFSMCTHDAGDKITSLDTEMAKFISNEVAKL